MNESTAWPCADGMVLQIDLFPSQAGQASHTLVGLGSFADLNQCAYGQQPPEITPAQLTTSMDSENPDSGSAYYFRATYNRTVIIPEDQLPLEGPLPDQINTNSTIVQPGDRPWFCSFNNTSIEGFIYVSQNSTSAGMTTSALGNVTTVSQMPFLPYVVKLTEQRSANSTPPYCEQKMVLDNGDLVSAGTTQYVLSLAEPAFTLETIGGEALSERGKRKRQQMSYRNSCRCQWMVQ